MIRILPRKSKKGLFSRFGMTEWLLFFNILFFILFSILEAFNNSGDCAQGICRFLALQPNSFFSGYYWTLLTSMFMHASFFHLLVNMLSLYFIGRFLETLIGKNRFLVLYLLSGLFAGLFFVLLAYFFGNNWLGVRLFGSPLTYAVGASGAIFGVAGVLALLTPRNKVYLLAGPILAIILMTLFNIYLPSSLAGILGFVIQLYIFLSIFSFFSFNPFIRKLALPLKLPFWSLAFAAIIPLIIIGLFVSLPIGNTAHLGGFLAGALYGFYLRFKYKKKTRIIADYFSEG